MERRTFLSSMAASALTVALPTPALCMGRAELRLAVSAHEHPWNVALRAKRLAERIKKLGAGAVDIIVCDYDDTKQALRTEEADLSLGIADCDGAEASAFYQLLNLPFGLDGNGLSAWIHDGDGQALWDTFSAQAETRSFLCGHTWRPMNVWLPGSTYGLGDLQGIVISALKARTPLWQQLGAMSCHDDTGITGSERGALPGTVQYSGLGETGVAFELTCSRELPDRVQEALKVACEAEYREGKKSVSLETVTLPRDIRIAAGNAVSTIVSMKRDSGDRLTQCTLNSFQAARQKLGCGAEDVQDFDFLYL